MPARLLPDSDMELSDCTYHSKVAYFANNQVRYEPYYVSAATQAPLYLLGHIPHVSLRRQQYCETYLSEPTAMFVSRAYASARCSFRVLRPSVSQKPAYSPDQAMADIAAGMKLNAAIDAYIGYSQCLYSYLETAQRNYALRISAIREHTYSTRMRPEKKKSGGNQDRPFRAFD